MNTLYEAFTAALFHFLWQGAAIAGLLSVVFVALRRGSSNSRYLAACIALALMVILPAATTFLLYEPSGAAAISAGAAQQVATASETVGSPVIDGATAGAAPAGAFGALPLAVAALRAWAIPLWSLGILLFSLRLLWAYGYVIGLRQKATESDANALAVARKLAERMGVARPFRVMISSLADGPSVIGWWRPVILLPSATLLGLTPWQLEAVLAHELAHIRRCDYLINLLQSVVEILLFYHPAVWWVSNCVRRERELCCDDLAVAISGDAVGYARTLTILERQRSAVPRARPAMAAADGWLGLRVRRLVGLVHEPSRPAFASGLLALGCAAGILAIGSGSADSVAQEAAREPVAAGADIEPVDAEGSKLEALRYYAQLVAPEGAEPRDEFFAYARSLGRWIDTVTWGGQWSDVDRVTQAARSIGLSGADLAGVESIIESYREQIASAAARVQSDEASLDTLLRAEAVDRGAVSSTLESLISARGEVDRATAVMALAVRERLTRDEWIRLQRALGGGKALYYRTSTASPTEQQAPAAPGGGARGGGARGQDGN